MASGAADGPPGLRRRRLRQDRGRAARRVQGGRWTASRSRCWCPTTVLAQQHFKTFRERFAPFPVRVEMLSRFRSREGAEAGRRGGSPTGSVDVVIGTHRLLQKDVEFKDLGPAGRRRGAPLRRGAQGAPQAAAHDGRRADADRDARSRARCTWRSPACATCSVIETPPDDRLPIRTYVTDVRRRRRSARRSCASSTAAGRSSSSTTASRRIAAMAAPHRELVPEARVVVGARPDGASASSSSVMLELRATAQADVLVCTDDHRVRPRHPEREHDHHQPRRPLRPGAALPAARARRPGAPAGLRLPPRCPREARWTRRPSGGCGCSQESTELGGGLPARRCATSRSAAPATCSGRTSTGTSRRSGSTYTRKLLAEAVARLARARRRAERVDPVISAGVEALLPEAYVPEVNQRLALYKRLAEIERPTRRGRRARRS